MHLNRDARKWGHSYTNQEQNWSVIYSFLRKRGLIVYLAALKKGAFRAAHPSYVIYRELPPPTSLSFMCVTIGVSNVVRLRFDTYEGCYFSS